MENSSPIENLGTLLTDLIASMNESLSEEDDWYFVHGFQLVYRALQAARADLERLGTFGVCRHSIMHAEDLLLSGGHDAGALAVMALSDARSMLGQRLM